ncbi:MAPEG family protein [Variovorax dokdonensis]|uniref:Microsomal glutathione S-transferase 1 n=1 Tax=Variovorax dokdonensis TaxID=344883 RepID=A0ABT7NF48_9BURK|nr:MAPEG family protein [Variovorax dokdonensis]MDM0046571.1 MAPEG family protein [Variovorax dokdonensis]
MNAYSLDNPIFQIYAVAASLAILKLIGHAFYTVYRMVRSDGGYLNPEDIRKTLFNPHPQATQLQAYEDVERARRMHRNELENTPAFLAAGLLLVAAQPSQMFAMITMFGYLAARLAHSYAYATERDHEVRAACFTVGAVFTVAMVLYVLVSLLQR